MKDIYLKSNKILVIYPQYDFTQPKLVEYLNGKFKTKKGGNEFTLGDIQQYLRRGFLPKPYGHHPIEYLENNEIGLKLVRVHFDKTVK